jgi:hypothetical protein
VTSLPKGKWCCRLCRKRLPKRPACCLCGVCDGRAMTPLSSSTKGGKWCHVGCALHFVSCPTKKRELRFGSPRLLKPVCDFELLDSGRKALRCKLCGRTGSVGVAQCVYGTCRAAFHPSCAMADTRYVREFLWSEDDGGFPLRAWYVWVGGWCVTLQSLPLSLSFFLSLSLSLSLSRSLMQWDRTYCPKHAHFAAPPQSVEEAGEEERAGEEEEAEEEEEEEEEISTEASESGGEDVPRPSTFRKRAREPVVAPVREAKRSRVEGAPPLVPALSVSVSPPPVCPPKCQAVVLASCDSDVYEVTSAMVPESLVLLLLSSSTPEKASWQWAADVVKVWRSKREASALPSEWWARFPSQRREAVSLFNTQLKPEDARIWTVLRPDQSALLRCFCLEFARSMQEANARPLSDCGMLDIALLGAARLLESPSAAVLAVQEALWLPRIVLDVDTEAPGVWSSTASWVVRDASFVVICGSDWDSVVELLLSDTHVADEWLGLAARGVPRLVIAPPDMVVARELKVRGAVACIRPSHSFYAFTTGYLYRVTAHSWGSSSAVV